MSLSRTSQHSHLPPSAPAVTVTPAFVMLFSLTPDALAAQPAPALDLPPIPDEVAGSYSERLDAMQQRLLGEPYLQARRLQRRAIGRLPLPVTPDAPTHADIYRVQHKSGAVVWEVWLVATAQPLDVTRWIGWLDMESDSGLARAVWRKLSGGQANDERGPEMALPLAALRFEGCNLAQLLAAHGQDLVKLLHRDLSSQRFKDSFVQQELAADFCRREEGLSLLARHGAIDVHAATPQDDASTLSRNTLPLLVTLELLCLERAVLRSFLTRFAQGIYGTVDDLVQLRRDIFDGLEEYYGTLAKTHGYTADATALGEKLFGIHDLFDSVVERLGALTFEITTRNQQAVNRLGFWLTTSFGAIETGFVAASIATWYYRDNLAAVLSWTLGVTLTTAWVISRLLRARFKA